MDNSVRSAHYVPHLTVRKIMKNLLLLTLSVFLFGCASIQDRPSVGVDEVLENEEKFEGKIITISGWCINDAGSDSPFAIAAEKNEKFSNRMILVDPEQRRDPYLKETRVYGSVTGKLIRIKRNGTTIYALTTEG